jgi:hypothetical protein
MATIASALPTANSSLVCVGDPIWYFFKPSDIANAYAVGVMPFAMCSDGRERSADFDCTIHQNEVGVANVAKATLPMPPAHIVHIEMRQRFGGSAMDDDRIDCAHND